MSQNILLCRALNISSSCYITFHLIVQRIKQSIVSFTNPETLTITAQEDKGRSRRGPHPRSTLRRLVDDAEDIAEEDLIAERELIPSPQISPTKGLLRGIRGRMM